MRIAHISDTHIAREPFFYEKTFKWGLKLVRKMKPDIVLHTGDVTGHGLLEEYEYALKKLKFDVPFLVIPGNHDSENVGYELFMKYFKHRGFAVEFNSAAEKIYMVGVDTTVPDSPDGRVGEGGLEFIKEKFDKAPKNAIRVLAMHHHLIPTYHSGREFCTVSDGGDLLKLLIDLDVRVVLAGHRHSFTVRTLRHNGKKMVIINAGTFSQITRGSEGHSFNIVEIKNEKVKVQHIPIDRPPRPSPLKGKRLISIKHTPPPRDMGKKRFSILHIGDTHFTKNSSHVPEMFERILEIEKKISPTVVLVTGDLTHDGSVESLELAKEQLSRISSPMVVIAGDRDFRPLTLATFNRLFGQFPKFYENEHIAVAALNSCIFEEKPGYIRRSRFARAVEWLRSREDKTKILMFHHPLFPIPGTRYTGTLLNAGDILTGITSAGVDLVAFSFGHVGFGVQVDGTVISNAGNASSRLVQERIAFSVNVIEVYEKGMAIREISLSTDESKLFGPFLRE